MSDFYKKILDNNKMWVYFNVPEAEYLNLKTKISKENAIPIRLLMANNEFFDQVGELSTIEADFNNVFFNTDDSTYFPALISFTDKSGKNKNNEFIFAPH